MKTLVPKGLTVAAVLSAFAITTAAGCGNRTLDSEAAPAVVAAADDAAAGESIFALDLTLVDDKGQRIQLSDLRDRPFIAAMVYTSCTTICITITEQMKAIKRQLASAGHDVRFVLFSLDPGRDTPAAMTAFAAAHKLDTTRWTLLAASEDGVRDLAAVLGVKYRPEENGDIAHSAMIFVIDRLGVVRYRQVGSRGDSAPLLTAVRAAQ